MSFKTNMLILQQKVVQFTTISYNSNNHTTTTPQQGSKFYNKIVTLQQTIMNFTPQIFNE